MYKSGRVLPWLKNPLPEKVLLDFSERIQGTDILDYGCGNGDIADFFAQKGFTVVGSDISSEILKVVKEKYPHIETIQAFNPSQIRQTFDAVVSWGVLHHVDISEWGVFMDGFKRILNEDGIILIGGHSKKDVEFNSGYRISPTTGEKSYALDSLEDIARKSGFVIREKGYVPFKEAYTNNDRYFIYCSIER